MVSGASAGRAERAAPAAQHKPSSAFPLLLLSVKLAGHLTIQSSDDGLFRLRAHRPRARRRSRSSRSARRGIDAAPTRRRSSAIARHRGALSRARLRPGHRVALQLPNRPEFLLHFLALNSLGAQRGAAQSRLPRRRARLRARAQRSQPRSSRATTSTTRRPPPRPATRSRMRPALHLGHHRQAERLPAQRLLFPQRRASATSTKAACAPCAHGEERLITPLPLFHMNALAVSTTAMILVGRLRGAARPLPSEDLVARRRRVAARPSCTTSA